VDYSRTRGLLGEILKELTEQDTERRLALEAQKRPDDGHYARDPIGAGEGRGSVNRGDGAPGQPGQPGQSGGPEGQAAPDGAPQPPPPPAGAEPTNIVPNAPPPPEAVEQVAPPPVFVPEESQ
jgi:hypothetical protein